MAEQRRQHEAGQSQPVNAFQRGSQTFIVTRQVTEARHPVKRALHHPTSWQLHKALLGPRELHHLQPDAMPLRVLRRLLLCVALVHPASSTLLPVTSCICAARSAPAHTPAHWPGVHFSASRCHSVSIATCTLDPCPAFRRRLHRASVHDCRRGLRVFTLGYSHLLAQVMCHGLKRPPADASNCIAVSPLRVNSASRAARLSGCVRTRPRLSVFNTSGVSINVVAHQLRRSTSAPTGASGPKMLARTLHLFWNEPV